MNFRLLLDVDVVDFIAALSRREQITLRKRLGAIQASPSQFGDFQETRSGIRTLDVHVYSGFAIYYWEDITDRHVKVLEIRRADV